MMAYNNLFSFKGAKLLPFLLLMCFGGGMVMGQTVNISGNSDNAYSNITDWDITHTDEHDWVVVEEPEKFAIGDYVMIYILKGLKLDTTNGEFEGYRSNTGNYALFIVDTIRVDTIEFNAATGFRDVADAPDPGRREGWVAQLIKVPVYQNARVTGELTAPGWDSVNGYGGILVLFVKNRLILNADINMDGKGFSGADPAGDVYNGDCYDPVSNAYTQNYYPASAMDSAGRKGEGPVETTYTKTRGKGKFILGGGGGNAMFSGGGGGGNYSQGSRGGGQRGGCESYPLVVGGEAGMGFKSWYYEGINLENYPNRIFFGGGGGTGTQDATHPATAGGDGGGIVVIIADTIETDGVSGIYANGESVSDSTNGASGGGGAGGNIVLAVNGYENTLTLSAIGGNGGNSTTAGGEGGDGGAGGGGAYWLQETSPLLNADITTKAQGPGSLSGSSAGIINDLSAPLNGLVYNSLPDDITVCSNIIPPKIDAAPPKGGDGSEPEITWIQSSDSINWEVAPGVNDQEDYEFTAPLDSTMHYSRVVKIGALTDSLTTAVTYNVLPAIQGNLIATDDLLACQGIDPYTNLEPVDTLSGAHVSTDTTFAWQEWNVNGETPVPAAGVNDERDYSLPVLMENTHFRRVVNSGVCTSISDTITITVLDSITDNTVSTKDTLCWGQSPELFDGSVPEGGNGSYDYAWEKSFSSSGPFIDAMGEDQDLDYTDSVFHSTHFFRRLVYSGADSSCVDTTEIQIVRVLDTIRNNLILEDALITLCQFDLLEGDGLTGSLPVDGDGNYRYSWEESSDLSVWSALSSDQTLAPDQVDLDTPGDLYIRRVVFSGKADVCKDTSEFVTLDIVEAISGNTITPLDETYCFGDTTAAVFTGAVASSGSDELGIEWQYRMDEDVPGNWQAAPEPAGGFSWDYKYSGSLSDTVYFRRLVWARKTDSVCTSIAQDSVIIKVQGPIQDNRMISLNGEILSSDFDSICAGEDILVAATSGAVMSGGDGNYSPVWEASSESDFSGVTTQADFDYSSNDFRNTVYLRRIISSGACDDTTAVLLVEPIELPAGRLLLAASQEDTVCASEWPVNLQLDPLQLDPNAQSYSAYVSYISENNSDSEVFDLDVTANPVLPVYVAADSAETYLFTLDSIVDNRQCVSESPDPNQPEVLVFESPVATLTVSDTSVCGIEITLTASNTGGIDWKWFASTAKVALDGSDTVTFTSTEMVTTALLDQWYNDTMKIYYGFELLTDESLNGCSDTAWVHVAHFQEVEELSLLKDTAEFYFDQTYNLFADEPELKVGISYWDVDDSGAGFTDDPLPIATDFELEQEHVYTWTIENGVECAVHEDELVVIQHDLRQYNGFSPDNDPLNQLFVIPGLNNEGVFFTFTLFNSWGTKVYEITDQEAVISTVEIDGVDEEEYIIWDGTLRGKETVAPAGTYYYTLHFGIRKNGEIIEEETKQGYIILRR